MSSPTAFAGNNLLVSSSVTLAPSDESRPSAHHVCWVYVKAFRRGWKTGQADLKVGLYINTRDRACVAPSGSTQASSMCH
jgi:hypothetical protein